ncbi:MAG: glycoside hydrolase family 3 C-terminal domain-containing protein, partial [Pseudonocardia sediminis]
MTSHAAAEAEIERRLAALDLPARVALLTGASMWRLHGDASIGLAPVVVSDGPVGVRGESLDERVFSLALPCPSAVAASWDPALARCLGSLLGTEARRQGVHVVLAPGVNLHRSAFGGRGFEYLSEDPLLTARIGGAQVRGVQGAGVAATAKHYVGNESETERMTVDVRVGERALHELYLAPFEALVRDAGAWLVLSAYNGVDGTTMSASPLLTDPLRTAWGFDGVVVSDWTAVRSTVDTACADLDLVMPGPDGPWGAALVRAVESGEVPADAVGDKVRRLLRLAARVGCLDGVAPAVAEPVLVPEPLRRPLLRRGAAAGTVLLRNAPAADGSPVLPLATETSRIAVLGPHAAHPRVQGGGSARVFPRDVVTPLDGLRRALGSEVIHSPGVHLDDRPVPLTADDVVDGLHVTLRGDDGAVLRTEHRFAGWLTWPEDPVAAGAAEIEVRTRLRVDVTGRWHVALGGVGHYALDLDGVTVLDTAVGPDDTGPWPPYRGHDADLHAGTVVDVGVRYRPEPGRPDAPSVHVAARRPRRDPDDELDHAVALAAAAGTAVVVVGTSEEIESEGFDRTTLALPGRQDELVRRVAAAAPRTVVVLNCGAPVLLPWLDDVPATVLAWFPGQEFGDALADVLTGAVEPGGRLPSTWPASDSEPLPVTPAGGRLDYVEGLYVGHRSGATGRLPFGHGLGYTAWELSDQTVTDEGVAVAVRNTGDRTGRQVVQAYLSRPGSAVGRPVRWLAGFTAVTAAPGERVAAEIPIDDRAFAHRDAGGWAVE